MAFLAGETFHEAAGAHFLWPFVATAAGFTGFAAFFRAIAFDPTGGRLLMDAGLAGMAFCGTALAIASSAHAFFSWVECGMALMILARPVGRTQFLAGRFAGVALLLGAYFALVGGALALMAIFLPGGSGGEVGAACAAQFLKCGVLAAATHFAAALVRSALAAAGIGAAFLAAGQLVHFAGDFWRSCGSPAAGWLAWGLGACIPDLHLYDLAGRAAAHGTAWALGGLAVYSAVYVAAFGGLAARAFRRCEL